MALPFFSSAPPSIRERCRDDSATKLSLRYAPYYHAMTAQAGTAIRLQDRDMVMLASNDYLGLSFHPKVIEAGRAAMLHWGTSPTGARVSNGSRAYHLELEEKLAAFLGKEACHVHAAGYLSCLSSVAAELVDDRHAIFLSTGDSEEIAARCAELLGDPVRRARLGIEARQIARRLFDPANQAGLLAAACRERLAYPPRVNWTALPPPGLDERFLFPDVTSSAELAAALVWAGHLTATPPPPSWWRRLRSR